MVIGILSSFGFMGWIGQSLSPLNTAIVPFLGLGLGIDEIFIMMRAFTRLSRGAGGAVRPEDTVTSAWTIAGPSILVTTAANFGGGGGVRVCVRVCVHVCMWLCVRACVCVCVCRRVLVCVVVDVS